MPEDKLRFEKLMESLSLERLKDIAGAANREIARRKRQQIKKLPPKGHKFTPKVPVKTVRKVKVVKRARD